MGNSDNPAKGAAFELLVQEWLTRQGLLTSRDFAVLVGARSERRPHKFDLGSNTPAVLVECKCHTWTARGNTPSAKLSVWNEAMYYFACAPRDYRKMFFVLRSLRNHESLAEHYIRRYGHLIPVGVEIWEFDNDQRQAKGLITGS